MRTISICLFILCFFSKDGKAHFQSENTDSTATSFLIKRISDTIVIKNGNLVNPASFGFNLNLGSKNNRFEFVLKNEDTIQSEAIVELTNPFLKNVKFYTHNSVNITDSIICGAMYIYNYRLRNHPNFQFPVQLLPGQTATCLMNIDAGNVGGDFKLMVWNKQTRNEFKLSETKYLDYFFIINISFLLLIGIAIFITKQRFHWYYFVFALLGFIYIYTEVGLGYKNLWPNHPYFHSISILFIANIYQIFGLLFIKRYFNTGARFPILARTLQFLVYAGILFELTIIGFAAFLFTLPLWFVKSNTIIFILSGLIVFGTAILSIRIKTLKSDAIWFIIGFSPHAFSILQLCLRPFGLYNTTDELWFKRIAPVYIDTIHPPNLLLWSVLWEGIIVFLLIIKRLRILYEENNRMTRQLALQRERNMQTLLTGVENERKRIAQELHDGSGVALSALKMKLNVLKENPGDLKASQITGLMKDVDHIYEDIRNISHNLMPKTLSKLGLFPAIDELVNQFRIAAPQIKFNLYKKKQIQLFSTKTQKSIFSEWCKSSLPIL